MRALVLCALAACGVDARDELLRGPVTVHARTKYEGAPMTGAKVIFQDPDGTERETTTFEGVATGVIDAGGTVTLFDGRGAYTIDVYTEVQPGATLRFGPERERPKPIGARMQLAGGPPPGAEEVFIASACTRPFDPIGVFDDRCGTIADLVLLAYHVEQTATLYPSYTLVSYQVLPAVAITDGATIAIDSTAWMPLETIGVDLVHADTVTGVGLSSTLGHVGASATWTAPRATARLPAVGPFYASVGLARPGANEQGLSVRLDDRRTIDVEALRAPWLTQSGDSWVTDGGKADAVVSTFRWGGNTLTVYGPPATHGAPSLLLPTTLADYGPRPGEELYSDVHVYRFEGLAPSIRGPRAANLLRTSEPRQLDAASIASTAWQ